MLLKIFPLLSTIDSVYSKVALETVTVRDKATLLKDAIERAEEVAPVQRMSNVYVMKNTRLILEDFLCYEMIQNSGFIRMV